MSRRLSDASSMQHIRTRSSSSAPLLAARWGRHSDLDFLIIKGGAHRRELTDRIRLALRGVNAAVDLVVATPEDIERYKDSHPLVYKPALREGQVVYDSP